MGYLCCCCVKAPKALVTVQLDTAQDLHKQDLVGAGERYICPKEAVEVQDLYIALSKSAHSAFPNLAGLCLVIVITRG